MASIIKGFRALGFGWWGGVRFQGLVWSLDFRGLGLLVPVLFHFILTIPRRSYPTPLLGRLLFKITDPNHKTRYPKKGVGYEPLGRVFIKHTRNLESRKF